MWVKEYNENDGTMQNNENTIIDFTKYSIKDYKFINENNEFLFIEEENEEMFLSTYSLWEYNNILCQNVGATLKLNKKYERLNGYIIIEFRISEKIKKEVEIKVDISII